jgi:hypothetical protein
MLDLTELHGMQLNLIPVFNLKRFRERRSSLIKLLLFLLESGLLNDRDCVNLINGGRWENWVRCPLAMLVLILNQINYLLEIIF